MKLHHLVFNLRRNLCLVFAILTSATLVLASPQRCLAAFPTAVSSPITDSVTTANVKVLGDSPAVAMGNLFLAVSQALANAAHNTTTNQQTAVISANPSTTQGVNLLYTVDTAAMGQTGMKPLASGAAALAAIPAEGFLGGATALAFDNDGVPGTEPDFWVVADEGFDFFRSSTGYLVLDPVKLRTLGNAPAPIVDLTIAIAPGAVEEFFPGIFDPSLSTASLDGAQRGPLDEPFDYYFGVRDANGEFGYFAAQLSVPSAVVPEPTTFALTATMMCGIGLWRRHRRHA